MQHGYAYTFATPDAFFEALFGPRQHDWHVVTRHQHLVLEEKLEQTARAAAAMAEVVADMNASYRARYNAMREVCAEVREWQQRKRHLRSVA